MEALNILEKQKSLNWEYDAEADVLYISVGKPQKAEGLDVGEGLIIRLNPKEMKMVGLTVIGCSYSRRFIKMY
jgi:uncharacterized protein YuzE